MKKVSFLFVALISMLAMTSCGDDKEKCVGTWVSETISEDGFSGNVYMTLNSNDLVEFNIKGHGTDEEDGVTMDIAFTIGINGKWDASLGTLNIELSQNSVHCSIDKIDAGDEDVNALIQMGLSDSEVKEELLKEMKDGFNVDDFNGSLELDFKNDNSMVLTDNTGEKMVFHRK